MTTPTFSLVQSEASRLEITRAPVAEYLALEGKLAGVRDVPDYARKPRLAFLSNFTVQGLPEVVRARGLSHNLFIHTYLAPYNQYAQEAMNEASGLHAFGPDLVYLLLDRATIPDAAFPGEVVRALLARSRARIVVADAETKVPFADDPRVIHFDFAAWRKETGNEKHWYTKYMELGDLRLSPAAFPDCAEALVGFAVGAVGATRKCVALDLDNTLWDGIVGEDGKEGIRPRRALQEFLRSRYERGIILAINSRNNADEALDAIETHPDMVLRKRHFAAWQINWGDKVSNMAALAKELNLGLDSFVFIDDDPFQQDLVRQALPEIATIGFESEDELMERLRRFPGFVAFALTDEDRRRGEMYAQERERRTLQASSQTLEDFLKHLQLEVRVEPVAGATLPRAAQLTQKTNQFNLTTRRYSEQEFKTFITREGKAWTIAAKDRFGDYGIVGVLMATARDGAQWRIDNFLLSCRILGRGVEGNVIDFLIRECTRRGVREIAAQYVPTSKNRQVETFWEKVGFGVDAVQGGGYGSGEKWYRRAITA